MKQVCLEHMLLQVSGSKKIEWTFGCHSSLRAYSAGILTSQRGLHVLPIMWRRLRGATFIIASVTRRKHTISSLSTVKWTSLLSLATRPLDAGSLFVLAQSRREDASLDGRGQQVGTWSSLEACRLLASNGITVEFKGIAAFRWQTSTAPSPPQSRHFGASEVALPCACLAHDDPHGIEQLGRESIARMAELGGGDARHYTTCEPSALLQGMQPCSRPPQRPSSAVSLTIDEGMSRDDAV